MLIDCSTCSDALAGGGDKARETLRSVALVIGEGACKAPDCEGASPSASEHDSASLHRSQRPISLMCRSLSSLVKQQSYATRGLGGVIDESARRKNDRATLRDHSPVSGPRSSARQRDTGNHNRVTGWKENAAGSVVAGKRVKARGAKGPYCKHANIKGKEAA